MGHNIDINVKVRCQKGPRKKEHFETYALKDVFQSASLLEMIDILNEQLITEDREPVIYDHDCREGICGMCSIYVNGHPHGPISAITTCQLHIHTFEDGDTIAVEPWRPAGLPIIHGLVVDRSAYDKIIQAGGYASVSTGDVPNASSIPIPKHKADETMDAVPRIGCDTYATACKNGSAMFFVSTKISQLALLPQDCAKAHKRVKAMTVKMGEPGFGNCTNTCACEIECLESASISRITCPNRQFLAAKLSD